MQSRAVSRSRSPLAFFWLSFAVSAAVKLARLNSRELWLDETYSAYMAAAPFRRIIHASTGDLNPPGYYLLLHPWASIAGTAPAQLRLFSVLLSVIAVGTVYLLARRIVGPVFAAFAAAMFAFAPMLFVYSLEVRSYFLLILLVSIALDLHWQVVVQRSSSKLVLVAYAVVAASLVYVHYLGAFLLVALVLHGLLTCVRNRKLLRPFVLAVAGALILMGPEFHLLSIQRNHASVNRQRLAAAENDPDALLYRTNEQQYQAPPSNGLKTAAAAFGIFPAKNKALLVIAAIPLLVLLLGVLYLAFAQADLVCRLFLLVSACLEAGLLLLHANETRYLLLLLPLLVVAFARTVQFLASSPSRKPIAIIAGCAALAVYIAGFARQATRTHGHIWQNGVAALRANYHPQDVVVFDAAYSQIPFDYFAHLQHFTPQEIGYPESTYQWWKEQDIVQGWGGPTLHHADVTRFADDLLHVPGRTVWIVLYEPAYSDPHDALLERLKQSAQITEIPLPPDPDAQFGESGLHLLRVQPAS